MKVGDLVKAKPRPKPGPGVPHLLSYKQRAGFGLPRRVHPGVGLVIASNSQLGDSTTALVTVAWFDAVDQGHPPLTAPAHLLEVIK